MKPLDTRRCEHDVYLRHCPICNPAQKKKEKDAGIPLEWYAARFFERTRPDDPHALMQIVQQGCQRKNKKVVATLEAKHAFGDLVCLYWPEADGLVRSIVHNLSDTDDAKQIGFIKAYLGIHRFKPGHKVKPWLWQAIKNKAYDIYNFNKEKSENEISLNQIEQIDTEEETEDRGELAERVTIPAYTVSSPQRIIEQQETRDALERALNVLPKPQAQAIRLQLDGLKIAEIAEQMQKTEGAIKKLLERGKATLQEIVPKTIQNPALDLAPEDSTEPEQIKTKRTIKDPRRTHRIGEAIRKGREGLAYETQKIFSLRLQGYRIEQIAEQLAITRTDVKNNLRVAYMAIRQSLKAEGLKKLKPGAIYFLKN